MKRGRFTESRLQFFLIDYLIVKIKEEIRYDQIFYRYKSFIINNEPFGSSEEELKDLYTYSKIFKKLTEPSGTSTLGVFAKRLLALDITTIFPLLLYIEGEGEIPHQDKEKIYSCFDSYITRRFLCGSTTKNYNNVFLDLLKIMVKTKNADDFIKYLQSKTADSNNWPNDNALKNKILNRPLYREEKGKSRAIVNLLLEIEGLIRTSKQERINISPDNLTIEHVMPQTWYENWPLNNQSISEEDFNISHQKIWGEEDDEE